MPPDAQPSQRLHGLTNGGEGDTLFAHQPRLRIFLKKLKPSTWFRERQAASDCGAQSWDILLNECASRLFAVGACVALGSAVAIEPVNEGYDVVLFVVRR